MQQIQKSIDLTNKNINNFINIALNDFNSLVSSLKDTSSSTSEVVNTLINKVLLAKDKDSLDLIKQILTQLLHVVQFKNMNNPAINILTKIISFVKIIDENEQKGNRLFEGAYEQEINTILYKIIDIIIVLKNKHQQEEIILRIIQTVYNLIDIKLLQYTNYNIFIRIYSILFDCCSQPNIIIQNISASALFALTQIIFGSSKYQQSLQILTQMCQFLFKEKKFSWIKGKQSKGIVWDIVVVAIQNLSMANLHYLSEDKSILEFLQLMYKESIQKTFHSKIVTQNIEVIDKNTIKQQSQKSINFKKGTLPDFVRFYKTFIYLSIHLSIKLGLNEIVPFKNSIFHFKVLYQLERNPRLYLFLEGISLILIEGSYYLIQEEHGIILLDIFNKVSEQLYKSKQPIQIQRQGDFYLQKICGDFGKISNNDYVRLIRNTMFQLRQSYQKQPHYKEVQQYINDQSILDNSLSISHHKTEISIKKKWQRLIKIIIKIIKNLTSLNLQQETNDQVVRKIISQLQYWFVICPTNRTRNYILEELYITSSNLESLIQSIKASQCVQIAMNIIYGYYQLLDTTGLSIIIRMIAGVRMNWNEGNGFDQLEEVSMMSEKLYTEKILVYSAQSFKKTIQAFVQCANELLSNIHQPIKSKTKITTDSRQRNYEKKLKMIDEILDRLCITLQLNKEFIGNEWNFLTGFWITYCSNKCIDIQKQTMNHICRLTKMLIKENSIGQQEILSSLEQLAKLNSYQVSKLILANIKQLLPSLRSQDAIIQIFRIIKVILEIKNVETVHNEIYDLLQLVIKQTLYLITSNDKLIFIIQSITFVSKDKNEQYKTINLLWNISDHLKSLAIFNKLKVEPAWKKLFQRINYLAYYSNNGETKQSCIHTFTQIIAELAVVINVDLFISILKQQYLQLFYHSLGQKNEINLDQKIDTLLQIDMLKVGIKNYIKITRKCWHMKLERISQIYEQTLYQLHQMIVNSRLNTLQCFYQIITLLQYFQEIVQNKIERCQFDKQIITKIIIQMEKRHQSFDKATLLWRKYKPLFEELKKTFVEQ